MAEDMSADPSVAFWQGTDVDITTIDKELSRLWAHYTRETLGATPVRTSIFNLVVHTDSAEEADKAIANLDRLTGRRPSRSIVLVSDRLSGLTALDARATIKCSRGPSNQNVICHEQVVITAHGRAADHLSSVVIPLLMPELPTYLWWPNQPPFGHRMFHRLLSIADQLVIDSAHFQSPGDGYADLARLCMGKHGVNDLHWARLGTWRDIVTQFFDGPTWVPYAWGILSINVEFGSGGNMINATAGTLLLLGWIAAALGWEPETTLDYVLTQNVIVTVLQEQRTIPIQLHFRDHGPHAAARLMAFDIVSQPRGLPPARFTVTRTEDLQHAEVTMRIHDGTDISRVLPIPFLSDEQLLGDELEQSGQNNQYKSVVEMASRIAGREVWVPA